jgi:amino acid transporter
MSESRGVRHQPPKLLADDDYVRQFGVEPKLKRGLHTLANAFFAIAFQSPTAGCLLLIGAGLALAGPAFWWVWPVILVFQFIVVLNWAEVISHYPLTGGIFQWARYLGGNAAGFFSGISYIAALILLLPAVGLIMLIVVNGLLPSIQFVPANEVLVSFLTMVVAAIVVTASVRVVSIINSIGVFMELIVLVGATLLLLFHMRQSPAILFNTGGTGAGLGYTGTFMIGIALLVALLTGSESAGVFGEEVVNSQVRAPRAIISAQLGVAISTGIFAFAVIMATPNLSNAMNNPSLVVTTALHAAFGTFGENFFLIAALFAVLSSLIATFAAVIRIMYGMARDGQLPASKYFVRLSTRTREPIYCIGAAFILGLLPLTIVTQIPVITDGIVSLLAIPYILTLGPLLWKRFHGWPGREAPFRLGRWGIPLTVIALFWVIVVFVDASWPRVATNPNWGPLPVIWVVLGGVAILAGIWWFAVLNKRPRVEIIDPEAVSA